MLALAAIFLITIIVSVTAVWLYRKISGWQGFNRALVGRPQLTDRTKIGLQQGFTPEPLPPPEPPPPP